MPTIATVAGCFLAFSSLSTLLWFPLGRARARMREIESRNTMYQDEE